MLGTFGTFEKVATTDPQLIQRWWWADPFANPGIAAGASDLLVLDLDFRTGVDPIRALMEWESVTGITLPQGLRVRTPSGGIHLYFRNHRECHSPAGWLPGVDVRATGAMVVAPRARRLIDVKGSSSSHSEVVPLPYTLESGSFSSIPEAPQALVDAINRDGGRYSSGSSARASGSRAGAPLHVLLTEGLRLGERDAGFHRLAWVLWGKYWNDEEIVRSFMWEVWLKSDQGEGFEWRHVESKIAQARRKLETIRATEAEQQLVFGGPR